MLTSGRRERTRENWTSRNLGCIQFKLSVFNHVSPVRPAIRPIDVARDSESQQQGAQGPLAVGGPDLHDSAIFARFYADGITPREHEH